LGGLPTPSPRSLFCGMRPQKRIKTESPTINGCRVTCDANSVRSGTTAALPPSSPGDEGPHDSTPTPPYPRAPTIASPPRVTLQEPRANSHVAIPPISSLRTAFCSHKGVSHAETPSASRCGARRRRPPMARSVECTPHRAVGGGQAGDMAWGAWGIRRGRRSAVRRATFKVRYTW